MSMINKHPCKSCIEKFKKENKRAPSAGEIGNMNKVKEGCECDPCYRASCFEFAGVTPPMEYPTLTETFNSIYI